MKTVMRFNQTRELSALLIPVILACLMLPQRAQAVSPPPDGGYANFTTAEGTNALFGLTTGAANTAVGWFSLKSVTTGSFNTGVGAGTLVLNTGDKKYRHRHCRAFTQYCQRQYSRGLQGTSQQYNCGTLGNIQGFDLGPN